MEPTDAKDLIDDAIERAESARDQEEKEGRSAERTFRDRVSVLIGALAVFLAIVHMAAAGAARESLLKGIEASDTFAYMQAKIVRETVLKTASKLSDADEESRLGWAKEAVHLRAPDKKRHGIGQLQEQGDALRHDGEKAAAAGEGYEFGETALQMAIVLLSIALIAQSRKIVTGAAILAAAGIGLAVATALGATMPWVA
ncbi:MAG: DUF4337 family protein [Sphingomonas sp.]